MLLHIVLFQPKAALGVADRQNLVGAIEQAHREIPFIRRFQIGKRAVRGAAYAASMPDYDFVALVEVDDREALQEYLTHPSHAELARLFWSMSAASLAYDFEVIDAAAARTFLT
jgi:hypothetical protein